MVVVGGEIKVVVAVGDEDGGAWFLALGWHLEEILVTWAHLEKKQTRPRIYTKYLEEPRIQSVETASQSIFSLCYLSRKSFSSTTMGDAIPIRTLGDYSIPSHEGNRNTIELLEGNIMMPF
ncbi:hypothetical protein Tco_0750635 [Tanacetum coccineum]|uniref:Uncharacterized protein n=1 Tax=Tanacetum coccineum TaxID=301880 RepID=A0ABQ4Z1T4_9ASTR